MLLKTISEFNLVLFQVDLSDDQFDPELVSELQRLAMLNYDVQTKLKPELKMNISIKQDVPRSGDPDETNGEVEVEINLASDGEEEEKAGAELDAK